MTRAVVKNATQTSLQLLLEPALAASCSAGRYFLARCDDADSPTRSWEIPLRRPLFPILAQPTTEATLIAFDLPLGEDAGYRWLRESQPGEAIDLLGPFGIGFAVAPTSHTLLLSATVARASRLLPLIDGMLDRAGRVTLLLGAEEAEVDAANAILANLPYAVEARVENSAGFPAAFGALLAWADQCALDLPLNDYAQFASLVRAKRMRPLPRYAQALVDADLACGVGACLACITPLARGGFTRACVHGPVFDLLDLA